ncbi:TPA_asm: MC043.1L [Molluscum contagiosum virus]|mgnify:CR=1 FL=1|uniref:MC043.1L n=1 Tax=Molluscum contagiosum virus TaxID=10279 RepID=A0A858A3S8_9POXV|nr:MC043.1 [Molluscum contagiosum virus subtype 1]QHW16781.1 MC043.1L [Molluscum contagiosum virus]AQY16970.1 MC043.1 [Molluscum contagiosum virus subtype 1]AQY17150.1 MC043.1 [Molluscum contagiosum virus subtype 1]AYO87502.1 MC043.1 [Molluscum contagiosum virus subtype 1]
MLVTLIFYLAFALCAAYAVAFLRPFLLLNSDLDAAPVARRE